MDDKKHTIKMGDKKFIVEKVSPAVKVETDEQGNMFITDPDTGQRLYASGMAKNLEEALAWTSDNNEEKRLREQNPDANFLEGHA